MSVITISRATHERFLEKKERHKGDLRRENITHDDFLDHLLDMYARSKSNGKPVVIKID
jgi:hypothetical protein